MSQSQIRTRNRISQSSRAGEGSSLAGWIGATFLYAAIVGATLFTFPHKLDITDESAPVVPVDLVTVADKTNIMPTARPEPKALPDINPSPVTPDQLKVDQPTVQQDVTEPPPVDTAPSEPVLQKPPPPPVPHLKPQTQPQPDKKSFSLDSVEKLLNQISPPAASSNARPSAHPTKGAGMQTAMNADLQDALRSQIARCWTPNVAAPNPQDMIVDFDLFLNPDGSVSGTPQLVGQSVSMVASNPYTRAASDAARRAIMECAPYKLPADKFAAWHEINPFHFDPRQMMGQ